MNPRPFAQIRWEHEQQHVYYLPPALDELEQPRPTYVIGTRGAGKTTLLKAMHWRERLLNRSLVEGMEDPFGKRYVGLYLKLPDVQLSLLQRWLNGQDADLAGQVTMVYLDLVWLQLAVDALLELAGAGVLTFTATAEGAAVTAARAHFDGAEWLDESDGPPVDSAVGLRALLGRAQRRIEDAARRREDAVETASRLPLRGYGKLGRDVAAALLAACPTPEDEGPWRLHVCMDEAESLSPEQQVAVNTAVRVSEAPVYFALSFVSLPADVNGTLIPELTLSRADREIVTLDRMEDPEFRDFAEGVASTRARILAEWPEPVSLAAALGQLDLNGLAEQALRRSDRKVAKERLEDAQALAEAGWQRGRSRDGTLPVLAAYVLRRRGVDFAALPTDPGDERRLSNVVRKAEVSAYLHLFREMRADPVYASAEVVVQLSDRCIRDFLWQLEELHAEAGDLEALLHGKLDARLQSRALTRASEQKLGRIVVAMTTSPDLGLQLVQGLGLLTARLQRHSPLAGPLDAEPGLFSVRRSTTTGDERDAAELLRAVAEAGYLTMKEEADNDEMTIRLHTSLAPAYGVSYRGAYRTSRLTAEDVLALARCPAEQLDRTVLALATKLRPEEHAAAAADDTLFELEEPDEPH